MAESKVQRENFIALQGWQVVDLGLKGNELIIYACIYGFSQDNQTFRGSLQYLADWTNSTKQGVMKCLKSLVEKGFIEKTENFINGVKFCEYHATKLNTGMQQSLPPMQQSLTVGMQQSSPNNIDVNTIDNTIDKKIDYQLVINLYEKICVSYPRIKSLSDTRKKAIKARLKKYSIDDFNTLFEKAEASSFLKGSNNRNWSATFDWLLNEQNMVKVLEGNFDNRKKERNASQSQDYSYLGNIRPEPLKEGEGLEYF